MGRGRTHSIRLAVAVALVATLAGVVAGSASALSWVDSVCPPEQGVVPELKVCPQGTIGTPYTLQIKGRNGCWPEDGSSPGDMVTLAVTGGGLPQGLSMSSSGLISGTPTRAGTARFFITESDHLGVSWCGDDNKSDREFLIKIDSALQIVTNTLPQNASTGVPYSATLQAALVTDPASPTPVSPDSLTWTVAGGTLPPGLTLSKGLISGTPTTEGTYQFQVQAALDSRKHLQTYTLTVRKPLAIVAPRPFATSPQPTQWEVGVPFSAKLAASGGTGTWTWSLLSGALPVGFALAADGTVAGTTRTPGAYRATLRLTDTEGRTADYAANMLVAPGLAVSTLALRPGKVGRLYRTKVVATGGVLPKAWKLTRGPLPRGIRFDRTLGVLSGTPTKPGKYRLTFQVTDGLKVVAVKTLRLDVLDA